LFASSRKLLSCGLDVLLALHLTVNDKRGSMPLRFLFVPKKQRSGLNLHELSAKSSNGMEIGTIILLALFLFAIAVIVVRTLWRV
jgi:hypothetical protein